MNKTYDLLILGAGPAGITAAIYAARKKLSFIVITNDIGGQAAWSGDIENYVGYQFITGPELIAKFEEHMNSYGIEVKKPENIKKINKEGNLVRTTTDKAEYLSKTLIVATGKRPRLLNVPGESEFKNKGVTYCATCDGPIFKDKNVAIIGGGNSGLDAALQMITVSPKVYMIDAAPQLIGDPIMIEKVKAAKNIEILNNARVKRIYGEAFVKGLEIERDGKNSTIAIEGVFVEIGLMPNTDFAETIKKNDQKEIVVDCQNNTDVDGIFAAGDVTNVHEKQIIVACGEGAKASLSAFKYLATHNF